MQLSLMHQGELHDGTKGFQPCASVDVGDRSVSVDGSGILFHKFR